MTKNVLKCYGCKELFRKEELVSYTGFGAKTSFNYCRKCLEKKLSREKFSTAVCILFGLKSPGPRIWKERQRLQQEYGYTDDVIIDCLNYLKEVEHTKFFAESLYLVRPETVEKMKAYKEKQEEENKKLIDAFSNIKETENS